MKKTIKNTIDPFNPNLIPMEKKLKKLFIAFHNFKILYEYLSYYKMSNAPYKVFNVLNMFQTFFKQILQQISSLAAFVYQSLRSQSLLQIGPLRST
jgi:hypothetical protein